MENQMAQTPQKKRGPPATGIGEQVVVRLQPAAMKMLDAWRAAQGEPCPTRAEALRRLMKIGVEASIPRNSL
jgi:hypothetical protein